MNGGQSHLHSEVHLHVLLILLLNHPLLNAFCFRTGMNTTIIMLFSVIIAFALLYILFNYRGFPGSVQHVGWKISGIWENGAGTIQVLIQNSGNIVCGHVVWADEDDQIGKGKLVGSLILKEVTLKSLWRWSNGIFIDPVTKKEFPLRFRLSKNKILSVHFFEYRGGDVLLKEEWQLVSPLL